ncbi:hypothetical protein ACQ4M3_19425 [Leptolyngbya sp. AN03gr2]|uniref:hypothetical protein n=1 Tax=unclassified Leptolyngbya TaxID=2650499 RepID=UPI003D30F730
MPSVISGMIALLVAVFTFIHFGSAQSSLDDQDCEATQVYRWSDRKCYTPQGE